MRATTPHLEPIFISSLDPSIPVVATWENGTSCSGSEISRNAWAVTPAGRVYSSSDFSGPIAGHYGDMAGKALNRPIVGISVTPTGNGYWMVASDGGIFAFGDAKFFGSAGRLKLTRPIEGMTATPSGRGYWMVASDGGIFAFGDAKFHGSTGGRSLSAPIAGMVPNGTGYTLIGQDGQLYPFA
jgi:ribosomal protein L24E